MPDHQDGEVGRRIVSPMMVQIFTATRTLRPHPEEPGEKAARPAIGTAAERATADRRFKIADSGSSGF